MSDWRKPSGFHFGLKRGNTLHINSLGLPASDWCKLLGVPFGLRKEKASQINLLGLPVFDWHKLLGVPFGLKRGKAVQINLLGLGVFPLPRTRKGLVNKVVWYTSVWIVWLKKSATFHYLSSLIQPFWIILLTQTSLINMPHSYMTLKPAPNSPLLGFLAWTKSDCENPCLIVREGHCQWLVIRSLDDKDCQNRMWSLKEISKILLEYLKIYISSVDKDWCHQYARTPSWQSIWSFVEACWKNTVLHFVMLLWSKSLTVAKYENNKYCLCTLSPSQMSNVVIVLFHFWIEGCW